MSLFVKNGSNYRVTSNENLDVRTMLPAGTYNVKYDTMKNEFSLNHIESFDIPNKLYGDLTKNRDRILNTFNDRESSTGVILCGEKGSGKSLLAKAICISAAEQGIPTIIINHPWFGDTFNTFVQSIKQSAIIFFDEFEKVYSEKEAQEAILTLFDGVYPTKKMFICTCNDKFKIDYNMKNRPGRIYYMLDFTGLEVSFVRDYCEENLINKSNMNSVCNLSMAFNNFNFDMLKAIVEEMNRYDETANEVIKVINTKMEFVSPSKYKIEFTPNRELNIQEGSVEKIYTGNPITNNVLLNYYIVGGDGEMYGQTTFSPNEIVVLDPSGKVVYVNSAGDKLVLIKEETKLVMRNFAF